MAARATATRARRHAKPNKDVPLGALVSQQESKEHPYRAGDIQRFKICTAEDHQGPNNKNCAANPHCLYGLGERKEGIWSAKQPLLKGLGEDPASMIRGYKARKSQKDAADTRKRKRLHRTADDDDDDEEKWREVPAGLANLGATCYLNVLLQVMFYNRRLRAAVYSFRPPQNVNDRTAKMVEIMQELQCVFGFLQWCKQNSYNPNQFAKLLCLDRGEQQDPVEFNRLFMQKIEECFGALKDSSLGSVVKELFRGSQKWVTKCRNCPYESGREQPFDEIELSLEGHDSVKSCLKGYLQPEELAGDNKYFCSDCNSKQEASRGIVLSSLPPVLNIHLIRYVFDINTGSKKKVKDVIFLDETLDFSEIRGNGEAPGTDVYELVAVLHHKGGSASHGHYTAEIKDTDANKWWFFDDTEVKPVKSGGAPEDAAANGEDAAAGASTSTTAAPSTSGNGSRRGRAPKGQNEGVVVVDSDIEEITTEPANGAAATNGTKVGGSKRRRDSTGGAATPTPAAPTPAAPVVEGGGKGSSDAYYLCYVRKGTVFPKETELLPPQEVLDKVKEVNDRLDAQITDFRHRKAELENQIAERRAQYERLFASASPPIGPGDHYTWVPTHWLRCWVTGLHLSKDGPANGKKKEPIVISDDQEVKDGGASSGEGAAPASPRVEVVDMTGEDEGSSDEAAFEPTIMDASVFNEKIELSEYLCRCCKAAEEGKMPLNPKLDPERATELKVVRVDVWQELVQEVQAKRSPSGAGSDTQGSDICFQGEEGLGNVGVPSYYCPQCVKTFQHKQEGRALKSQRTDELMRALLEPEPVNGTFIAKEEVYLLSRKWEQLFKKDYEKKRKVLRDGQVTLDKIWASPAKTASGEVEEGDLEYERPNAGITCEHQRLTGNTRQYKNVSAACWGKVVDLFPKAIPYTADEEQCEECKAELQKENEEKKAKKEAREYEVRTKELKSLAKRKLPYPPNFKQDVEEPVEKTMHYMLVTRAWLDAWRVYINDFSQSKPLPPTNETLICEHRGVMVPKFILDVMETGDLPKLSESTMGDEGQEVGGDLLTPEEWRQLMEMYSAGEGEQPPQERTQIAIKLVKKYDLPHARYDYTLESTPAHCMDCINSRKKDLERRRVDFSGAKLKLVVLKPGQEVPGAAPTAPPPPPNSINTVLGKRRSTRGRQRGGGDNHMIEGVDSSDTVSVFKLKAWQVIQFEEGQNITLYHEGEALSDQARPQASYHVRADSVLYGKMFDAPEGQGVFEEGDFSTGFEAGFGGGGSGSYRPEQGFMGTFLAQSHSFNSPPKPQDVAVGSEEGHKDDKDAMDTGEEAPHKAAEAKVEEAQGKEDGDGDLMEVEEVRDKDEARRGRTAKPEGQGAQTPPRARTRTSQSRQSSPSKRASPSRGPILVYPTPSPPPPPPQTRATTAAASTEFGAFGGSFEEEAEDESEKGPSLVSPMYNDDGDGAQG